ncbi:MULTISPECIES: ABC transporter permease [Microbacterium]|jgi:peptide/nickel transport system permease protein|uniref:ABC transporter permease n=1 Tax=Microbacterium TaxID=33882 RepID=UPI0006F3E6E7|nr:MULTISPECIES: ABC transporter permease [unclassified Microbacterium]MBN9199153.1 ABC transporter permease [Microbacterium ginsengisoli]MCK9917409.1 ABC transporter permease [Microbacteriaceae bacterium K1510]ODU52793.1 MAG: peptide ABC transporter permease [Microbacterium sp. SCN 70-10]KQR99260.1 peptide ABC transporter permease [Microbacterium sp. Leaf347]KQS02567.1 peptide ABC transporter permease [Microbacterium sp. Leaf351]
MTRYILGRLAQAVLVLWAAYTVAFLLLFALPSDPVKILAGADATDVTEAQLDQLRHQFGLDKPLWQQYLDKLGALLHGDLGTSITSGRPVAQVVGEAIPPTLQIAALALVIAVIVGTAVAVGATWFRIAWLRSLLLAMPPLGVAVPSFWLGLLLIQWFSFQIPIFPAVGDRTLAAAALPAIVLAVPAGANISQLLAKSLSATLGEPFIGTARAKGASRSRVHLRHALRNASLPAFTITGLIVGQLLAGTVVTETVFGRPGIGRVTAAAVEQQDLPVVLGVVLFAAAAFVIANLFVDLLYPVLDPRISVVVRRAAARARASSEPPAPSSGASAPVDAPPVLAGGAR